MEIRREEMGPILRKSRRGRERERSKKKPKTKTHAYSDKEAHRSLLLTSDPLMQNGDNGVIRNKLVFTAQRVRMCVGEPTNTYTFCHYVPLMVGSLYLLCELN